MVLGTRVDYEPIISRDLFDDAQLQLERDPKPRPNSKEFQFTKLISCATCNTSVVAEEHFKQLRDGGLRKYVYYHCTKRDPNCKQLYIREDRMLTQILALIDKIDLDELGLRERLEREVARMRKFTAGILQQAHQIDLPKVDCRAYAKYTLKEGTLKERRELLGCLKSKLYLDGQTLVIK